MGRFKEFGFKKTAVVVEIGDEWLKIAEKRFSGKGGYISKLKFIELSRIKGSVADAVSKVFRDLKLNKKSVITYIPRYLTAIRILEFPSADPKEIGNMVRLQIGKQTPYSEKEIVFAYKTVDSRREGYIKVMLVIAKLDIIDERVEIFEKAGIEVEKVALSSEGVYNWFDAVYMPELKPVRNGISNGLKPGSSQVPLEMVRRSRPTSALGELSLMGQCISLVDIDSGCSDFIVIRKGELVWTRNIFIGANHLSEEQDEWRDKFIEELKISIQCYHDEEKDSRIAKIFLSGAAGNIKDLSCILSAKLDAAVEITDPVRNIRIKKDINLLRDDNFGHVSVSSLFGMAIEQKEIKLDLTPPEVRIKKLMDDKRKNLTVIGILFAAIAMMAVILLSMDINNKNTYLAQLKNRISRIEKDADEGRQIRMRINLVEKRMDAKGTSINILNEIYKLTPREIYFTKINIEKKKQVILKGRAFAMSDVFKFVATLENSQYFRDVKAVSTTTTKEKDIEYANFEIVGSYQKEQL